MKNVIFVFLVIFTIACKPDVKNTDGQVSASDLIAVDTSTPADPATLTVPNSCDMISEAKLQEILKIVGSSVNIKDASDPANPKARSCFFKWDDVNTPNAGILIQIMTNPVYEDYPEYISNFVSSKITDGETVLGMDEPTKFKKIVAGNTNVAYSWQQGRCYWNKGNNYLFMLAFNVSTLNEENMATVAEGIITEINKNFPSNQ